MVYDQVYRKKQIFTNIRQYVHLTFNSIRIDFLQFALKIEVNKKFGLFDELFAKKDDLMDCDRRTHLNFSVLTKSGEKRRVFHYCNDGLTVMYGLDVLGSLKLTMYINIPEHTPFNLEPEPQFNQEKPLPKLSPCIFGEWPSQRRISKEDHQ